MNLWNNTTKAAVLFVGIVCVLYGTRPIFPEAFGAGYGKGRVAFSARPQRGMSAPAYGVDPAGFQGTARDLRSPRRGQSEPMTGGGGGY